MSGVVSHWLGSVDGLPEVADWLLRVQIENRLAIDLIRFNDGSETLFYCDSSYIRASRGHENADGHEMTDARHRAPALRSARGRVAVSGYRCSLMNELWRLAPHRCDGQANA
ncbi:MAG: hypothetical protein ACREFY_20830 [Acetobacteraceae bacterium]